MPNTIELEGDFENEEAWRTFMARYLATQALAQQRTEWYLRSIRTLMLVWFLLSIIGAAAVVILTVASSGT